MMTFPESEMQAEFSAVFKKVSEGYIGFVQEIPGANTQGDTLEQARENLAEAVTLVLEADCALAEELRAGRQGRGAGGDPGDGGVGSADV